LLSLDELLLLLKVLLLLLLLLPELLQQMELPELHRHGSIVGNGVAIHRIQMLLICLFFLSYCTNFYFFFLCRYSIACKSVSGW
jgi:hypothetical protein